MVLQGLDMNVDDIDILCDKETALLTNTKLAGYLVEKVDYKESAKFKSYYGKFLIEGIGVEIMGDWQILDAKQTWSKMYVADADSITHVQIGTLSIPVTKISLELELFARMGRWTAYQKLRKQVDKVPAQQGLFWQKKPFNEKPLPPAQ